MKFPRHPNLNWKYILIIVILAVAMGGAIYFWQDKFLAEKEVPPSSPTAPVSDGVKKGDKDVSDETGIIGIHIEKLNETLLVRRVYEDKPGEKAGLKANDKIIEIDGKSTRNLSEKEATELIRGKSGTEIVLTIRREGWEEDKEFKMKRVALGPYETGGSCEYFALIGLVLNPQNIPLKQTWSFEGPFREMIPGEKLFSLDIDLHAYTPDGKYDENQILGAEPSGDLGYDEEWIFMPGGAQVYFVVSSRDIQEALEANAELRELTEGIETYEVRAVGYDEFGQRYESDVITEQIEPGMDQAHLIICTHDEITITPASTIDEILKKFSTTGE